VEIGDQIWMAENLAYLPRVDDVDDGSEDESNGKYYYVYEYTPLGANEEEQVTNAKVTSNYKTYGVLYNWNAAMNEAPSSSDSPSGVQGACPEGWHLPSDTEWKSLEMHLGMSQSQADIIGWRGTTEGEKLKSTSWDGSDDFGFSALPAGYHSYSGLFNYLGSSVLFWTATENSGTYAWRRRLTTGNVEIQRRNGHMSHGYSVRCLKGRD
jgi:uncharacterized protein (TIGR02145 family)